MLTYEQIVKQIGASVEELGRAVEEELRSCKAEMQSRIDELTAELETTRTAGDEALGAKQGLEQELEIDRKRIETLVQKLKEARQEAAEARDEVQRELQQRLEQLENAAEGAREELDQERSIRKRLEKGAATDEKRLNELEKALAEGGGAPAGAGKEVAAVEIDKLRAALNDALTAAKAERTAREGLEDQLGEAHKLIEALEKAVKSSRELSPGTSRGAAEEDGRRLQELAEKLASVQAQLEEEQRDGRKYARAQAEAQRRIAELEQALDEGGRAGGPSGSSRGGGASATRQSTEKPLPHELRPPPRPGTLFRPDWDLQALPCKSADQVLQAWGSVSNVQLSLEGYPSQYCTAFLVVLKFGRQKQLFVLFNLKESKHKLVCVPGTPPGDEAGLNKLIGEGQKYLQMSGFELEKIPPDDMGRVLGGYFLQK
ncbi:MAG: hypothetical protein ACYC9I_04105 [Desulfuromonadales bacterium]